MLKAIGTEKATMMLKPGEVAFFQILTTKCVKQKLFLWNLSAAKRDLPAKLREVIKKEVFLRSG